MRNSTSLLLKFILANFFIRSAQCAVYDSQYSVFRNNLIAVRNQLLSSSASLSEQEMPSLSINNIEETASLSAIYTNLPFKLHESRSLILENTVSNNPISASGSEGARSVSAEVQKALDGVQSSVIDIFQPDNLIAHDHREITPMVTSNKVAVPVTEANPAIHLIINNKLATPIASIKPPASIVGIASDVTNKPVAQHIPPASNVQTTPIVNNKPVVPIIGAVVSVINKSDIKPVASVISNKPAASVQIKVPVASIVNNRPIASVVNNRPIASVIYNNPAVHTPAPSVNIANPIASVIHQRPAPSSIDIVKPMVSAIQHVPAPSVDIAPPSVAPAATAAVHLEANVDAEKNIKPCYRSNKMVTFSQYWIPRQNDWDETNDGKRVFLGGKLLRRMNDANGKELGWVPVEMYDKCKMEGTCLLANGDLININNSTDSFIKVGRAGRVNNVFGLGSGSQNLVPFISVAANDLAIGQKLYIPQLNGVHLGGGVYHNGCVRVDDDSWSFGSCQLDFFVLSYVDYLWLALDDKVTVKFQDCQLENYVNKYHLAMVKASMDEKIIPSLLDAKYVPLT